jgi:phospholipase C
MVGFKLITVAAISGLALAVPNIANKGDWKSKIKNVVILVEENRSFDTFAGGLSYSKDIDGLLHHNYCNSMSEHPKTLQGKADILQERFRPHAKGRCLCGTSS